MSGEVGENKEIILLADHEYNESDFNVLLLQPPLPSNIRVKTIVPMNLLYLASYLRDRLVGINVAILDGQAQDLNYKDMIGTIGGMRWDIIGMGYWTVQYYFACNLSRAIKSMSPETAIVHGGVHPSLFPLDALRYADYCVIGEGEVTFSELVNAIRDGAKPARLAMIQGLSYRDSAGDVVTNRPREFEDNLDEFPFPAWDLVPIDRYQIPLHVTGGGMLPIIGSRGCPYDCSFCASPAIWHRKIRYRSPENIVTELQTLADTLGVTSFHFWDDNLLIRPERIEQMCKLILQRNLRIEWVGLSRAEHVNRAARLLPLMKEAGCVGIEVGVESVNPANYADINKRQELGEVKQALDSQKDAGLAPLYTYMAFNPGETINGYYFQKEFLDEVQSGLEWFKYFHYFTFPLYLGQFCTPYPGTPLYDEAGEVGIVLIEEWEDRHHHQINFIPNSLLDDVPVLTTDEVTDEHYYLYLRAVLTAFWNDFPADASPRENAAYLHTYWRFLFFFLRKCNGQFTLRQIITYMTRACDTSFEKAARASALAVYLFGQIGLIRSGLYGVKDAVELKEVTVPAEEKRYMNSLLSLVGVERHNLNPFASHSEEEAEPMIRTIRNNSNI